jgi:hypothetical protein
LADRFKKPIVTALRQQVAFRQRHHEIEKDRAELIARLSALKEPSRKHPGYKRVLRLLNNTFGKSSLEQRPAVLRAATWLIKIVERQGPNASDELGQLRRQNKKSPDRGKGATGRDSRELR